MALIFVETLCGHEGFEIFNSVMFALCGVRVFFIFISVLYHVIIHNGTEPTVTSVSKFESSDILFHCLFCKTSTFLIVRCVSLRMSTATRSSRGILTTSPSIIILAAVAFYPTSLRVRQVRLYISCIKIPFTYSQKRHTGYVICYCFFFFFLLPFPFTSFDRLVKWPVVVLFVVN